MRVRVVAGQFGGRFLNTPPGSSTHPMGERVRSAVFSSLSDRVIDAEVLDAFAGSGAIGFEAISRGANNVTFVEKNRLAAKVIRENQAALGLGDEAVIINATVINWLQTREDKRYDLIFADPPYHDLQLSTVKKLMGLLKPGGTMVLSHTGRGDIPIENGIVVVDNRSYGNACITFYRREG